MLRLMIFISIVTLLLSDKVTMTSNTFLCRNNQHCTFLEYCPDKMILMKRNELPIHSFRQSICDYSGLRPKVCCDISYSPRSILPEQNIISLLESKSNSKCGKSLIKNNIDIFGSYPFLARIGFINLQTGHMKYPCSGTIINERAVITTASCALANSQIYKLYPETFNVISKEYAVAVGEFNTETDPDCNPLFCGHKIQHYNISYIIKHPNYCPDTFANNIALIRLEKPIHFEDLLTMQQELKMILLPKENCMDFSNQGYCVELCASGETEPCSAYNGSPLLYKYGDTYFLVGILSYGSNCDEKSNLPLVFVDVQKYARWLLENL